MSARKRTSWREKLADDKGLPKVIPITGKLCKHCGEGTCAIPSTREVDGLIRRVRKGMVTSFCQARVSGGQGLNGTRSGAHSDNQSGLSKTTSRVEAKMSRRVFKTETANA